MPYQIANNLALVVVTLIVLYIVLITDLLKKWIWEINMVTYFLMLVSDTTIVEVGLNEALSIISSSFSICFLALEE